MKGIGRGGRKKETVGEKLKVHEQKRKKRENEFAEAAKWPLATRIIPHIGIE
jgi:hypothetical protein